MCGRVPAVRGFHGDEWLLGTRLKGHTWKVIGAGAFSSTLRRHDNDEKTRRWLATIFAARAPVNEKPALVLLISCPPSDRVV